MPVVIKYVCDRCQYEQETAHRRDEKDRVLFQVAITCEGIGIYKSQFHTVQKAQEAIWCQNCVDEMGVQRPLIRAEQDEKPRTLDDMVREIVEDAVQNRSE